MVVVSIEIDDATLSDQIAAFVDEWIVAPDIAERYDPFAAEIVDLGEDGLQSGQIAVDVGYESDHQMRSSA